MTLAMTMISSFRNELNYPFSSTGDYFRSEIVEGGHKVKNKVLVFRNVHF